VTIQADHAGRGTRHGRERGIALVLALVATLALSVLGLSLLLTTSAETLIAAHYRTGTQAVHAADAALERVLSEVAAVPDWTALLTSPDDIVSGVAASFGGSTLTPTLADGRTLDLVRATNLLNCPQVFPPAAMPCTAAQMDHVVGERLWGANNPRWRLFARGPLSAVTPGSGVAAPYHVAVWVADDPAETDHDPSRDGTDQTNPGTGMIQLHAEAFGPVGAHRSVEATIARSGGGARIVSWRLIR
jgi:type IV pilus assembly PilX-like protein